MEIGVAARRQKGTLVKSILAVVALSGLSLACSSKQPVQSAERPVKMDAAPTPATKSSSNPADARALNESGDAGHSGHSGHTDAGAKSEVRTPKELELAAYKAALPVFKQHCADCHTPRKGKKKKKAWKHFTMGGYPFGGHHAHEIGKSIRHSLGVGSKKATMPKDDPGAVKGDQLALIVAWSRAFDKANPAKPGHKHGHGHNKKRHKHKH